MENYSNLKFIQDGTFSSVYKAQYSTKDDGSNVLMDVALKIADIDLQKPPHSPVVELRLLRLLQHKNIISVLSSFIEDNTDIVMIMPFMPYTLDQVDLSSDLPTCRNVIHDIVDAIRYIHDKGIIHRDIKPQNILLESVTGPVYLTDFGTAYAPSSFLSLDDTKEDNKGESIACLLDGINICEREDRKISDIGTGPYRAPELLFGSSDYTQSVDLWSLGCVIAEIWLHTPLFKDNRRESSEISLANIIFRKLGTPTLQTWPEARKYPSFELLQFIDYTRLPKEELLPSVPDEVADIVCGLLTYESSNRTPTSEILLANFFYPKIKPK
ncbi:kinase-like domain-containing protein [Dipodascopsis uninucleata]